MPMGKDFSFFDKYILIFVNLKKSIMTYQERGKDKSKISYFGPYAGGCIKHRSLIAWVGYFTTK